MYFIRRSFSELRCHLAVAFGAGGKLKLELKLHSFFERVLA
jgi:hypothetical protein